MKKYWFVTLGLLESALNPKGKASVNLECGNDLLVPNIKRLLLIARQLADTCCKFKVVWSKVGEEHDLSDAKDRSWGYFKAMRYTNFHVRMRSAY